MTRNSDSNLGRLFVMDRNSKQRYLVDTGSGLCVFSRRLLPVRLERTDYTLYAANGTTTPTNGWTSRSVSLGLRRDITWRFVIADVDLPIIGLDLLSHHGILSTAGTTACLTGSHRCKHQASLYHHKSSVWKS